MPFNVPIFLTWLRIILIPLVVGVFYLPDSWINVPQKDAVATIVFVAAALTDWLDGWLARRLNQTSRFGAFLDPVADKLMVTAALLVLVAYPSEKRRPTSPQRGHRAHHRGTRNYHFGVTRMDGPDRRVTQCGCQFTRQDQDRHADGGHSDVALRPLFSVLQCASGRHLVDLLRSRV